MSARRFLPVLAALCAAPAIAAPIPVALQIYATISIDTSYSQASTSGATQAGTLSLTAGGSAATPTGFLDDPSGMNPSLLSSQLSATGDGIGALLSMSGALTGGAGNVKAGPLFADYLFQLSNTSATASYAVTFRALASNAVAATGGDAYAHSDLSVKDKSLNEVFFTDFFADTVNAGNNFQLSSASDTFTLTLTPGASTELTALQRQEGATFVAGSFSANLGAFISIDDIRCVRGCDDPVHRVPLPGSLSLATLAMAALLATTRRRPA